MREIATHKEIVAWAMFDFANSAYASVVLTAVYGAYFVRTIAAGAGLSSPMGTLLWTIAIAAANFLILSSAPVLGAIADFSARKKLLLTASAIGCSAATCAMGMVAPGHIVWAFVILVLATFLYGTGEDLVAAFLPEISPKGSMGRVSAFGWTVGYIGGILTLTAVIAYISWARHHGIAEQGYVPICLYLTGLFFLFGATPTFFILKERAIYTQLPRQTNYIRIGFARLADTIAQAHHYRDLFRFLAALLLYSSGAATVIHLASIYSKGVMHFNDTEIVALILTVNVMAAIGAFSFGFLHDHFGAKTSLNLALVLWVSAVAAVALCHDRTIFLISACAIGTAQGSTYSCSRALIGQFAPPGRSAEFFGLWGLVVKASAILGPLSYGMVNLLAGGNQRVAVLSTLVFFAAGMLVLQGVNGRRGQVAAGRPAAPETG